MLKLDINLTEREALQLIRIGLEMTQKAQDVAHSQVLAALNGPTAAAGDNKALKSPTKPKPAPVKRTPPKAAVKGQISAAGRASIAAAQKARWAKIRKAATKAAKTPGQRLPLAVEEPELAAAGD